MSTTDHLASLPERQWRLFIHLSFIWLAILALHFRNERLFADAAYYLLHTVDSGLPWVDHQRYSLVLAELPALIALHLGMSLKGIILTWSLGHVAWAWGAAIWCIRLKRADMAVAIVLLQFIGQTYLFFSPMMEICYGGIFAALLLALWQARPVPTGKHLLAWAVISLLLVTSHPEHVITLCVVTALVWVGAGRNWRIPLLALAPLAVFVVLKVFWLSDYESSNIPEISSSTNLRWTHGTYLLELGELVVRNYPDLLVIMAFGIVLLLRAGRAWSVLALVGGALAVVIAVNTAMEANIYSRYHESAYFPMVVCGVLLGTMGLHHVAARWSPWILLFAFTVVGVRSGLIIRQGNAVAKHMAEIERNITACLAQGKGKCIIREVHEQASDGSVMWSVPMEAMLLARAEQGVAVSLITEQDMDFDKAFENLPEDMVLLRRWEPRTIASLHPWFRMEPGPYLPLDTLDSSPLPGTAQ